MLGACDSHRDENVIPVAAFYRPETRINYFAKVSMDNNAQVCVCVCVCLRLLAASGVDSTIDCVCVCASPGPQALL